jgi:hypothetical protein
MAEHGGRATHAAHCHPVFQISSDRMAPGHRSADTGVATSAPRVGASSRRPDPRRTKAGVSGASPCRLTTISWRQAQAQRCASAQRSVPFLRSASEVITTSAPNASGHGSRMRSSSVATTTRSTPLTLRARRPSCGGSGCATGRRGAASVRPAACRDSGSRHSGRE